MKNQQGSPQNKEDISSLLCEYSRWTDMVINSVIHDLQNVLGVIRGFTDLSLRAAEPESSAHKHLTKIFEGANAMTELTERMRMLGRPPNINLNPELLGPIVEEAIETFRVVLPSGVEMQANIAANEAVVATEPDQIKQAVYNLCLNACDALEGGAGSIELSLTTADTDLASDKTVNPSGDNMYVYLSVKDSGSGMAEEVLDKAFVAFFTTKDPEQHAGLGLTLVKEIVKYHGGTVFAESQLKEGATVTLQLPLYAGEKGSS